MRSVVTIGNFDGVHRGHRLVLHRAREVAGRLGVDRVAAVTFDPHPMKVLRPDHAPPMLTDVEERVRLLEQAGADEVVVLAFDRGMASWPPERFVTEIVVERLHAAAVVVGENFRFGAKAAGDVGTLRELGPRHDFVVEPVPLDGDARPWSSSSVREWLAAGDVAAAAEALGRPFDLRGVVVEGDRRGRELGFPTANVPAEAGFAVPADGVYAGWLRRCDQPEPEDLPAAISVGTSPTFAGERARSVEAYVLDRTDLELYGAEVEIGFVARIRVMERFDSVEALVETMKRDVEETRKVLGR
ncbi:MAG TPA: bifunctional riboflavin kinase/FAD synthetase [Nocardioidaceae bacterium]|nr:bifunctional riboflavin kinase/FAD synthetase [Nocardioidaceae bacterium]